MKKILLAALIVLCFASVFIAPVFACNACNSSKVGTITNPNGPIDIDKVTTHLHLTEHGKSVNNK